VRVRAASLFLSFILSFAFGSINYSSARSPPLLPETRGYASRGLRKQTFALGTAGKYYTRSGSNNNICTSGVSLSTLLLRAGLIYRRYISRLSALGDLKKRIVCFSSIHPRVILPRQNEYHVTTRYFMKLLFIFSTLMEFMISLKLIFSSLINVTFIS